MHRNKKGCSGVRAKLLDDHHQNQNVAPTKFRPNVTRAKRATVLTFLASIEMLDLI